MKTLYVAGPVPRPDLEPNIQAELTALYREIRSSLTGREIQVILPLPDPEWDTVGAKEFLKETERRIKSADAVLTVLLHETAAAGAEARIAADLKKKQALIVRSKARVTRILAGLDGIHVIGERKNLKQVLTSLLPEAGTSSVSSGQPLSA